VYVGNLPFSVTWQELKDHFKQAGTVLHADVMMRNDGRSQGCGLVSFASAKEARHAIATLHDSELEGRLIFVREDREAAAPVAGGGGGGGGRGGAGGGGGGGGASVYVGNLPFSVTWQGLKDHFKQAGFAVQHADVMVGRDGRSKGCGLVSFASAKDARNAINEMHDSELDGRKIFVREDREA